ncbi:TetR/AcrR family transcriptional regulator [uncultured Tateyamaria sp.]|uniref:TetR/AcrR family transcriptional regulator n=1 Tax=uncultured Tateyamaria sp. TaxID=455651 RepID=UPI002624AB52|nr:TetR/AcrR family transcriptional regulator [uncultured Tateyamaria sp.]
MPRKPQYDRDDLINRARDLFWARGWAGTSLKDLEGELKLKPGSFYAAFGSKDALFELALRRYARDGTARLHNLAETHGALTALKLYPRLVIDTPDAPAKACMMTKTLLELQAQDHPLAGVANDNLRRMEQAFAQLFQQAQADKEIGATYDPFSLARRYQSDLLGLRMSAERTGVDALAIAQEIADGLDRL